MYWYGLSNVLGMKWCHIVWRKWKLSTKSKGENDAAGYSITSSPVTQNVSLYGPHMHVCIPDGAPNDTQLVSWGIFSQILGRGGSRMVAKWFLAIPISTQVLHMTELFIKIR